MDKMRKIIIIVIAVILVVLIVIGGISLFSYNKDKGEEQIKEQEQYTDPQITYESQDELLNVLQTEYVSSGETVYFDHEENDCWYYRDSLNFQYIYCVNNPSIQVIVPES